MNSQYDWILKGALSRDKPSEAAAEGGIWNGAEQPGGGERAQWRNGDNLNGKNLTGTSVLVLELPSPGCWLAGGHMSCLDLS